jgi:PAS domain S-box-containing protein
LDGRAVVDVSLDPIVATNRERRIVYWNRAAESTYGFGRDEALGRRAAELLQTRFPIPLAEIEEAVGDTGLWTGSIVQFTKDAQKLTVESRRIPRLDGAGKRTGVIAIDRDVTARERRPGCRWNRSRLQQHPRRDQHLRGARHKGAAGTRRIHR